VERNFKKFDKDADKGECANARKSRGLNHRKQVIDQPNNYKEDISLISVPQVTFNDSESIDLVFSRTIP